MRELNSRAWSVDGECWCTRVDYDGYKKEWSGIVPVLAPDNRIKRLGEIEDTNIIVELPTGLKDKNGKKIYEGDIVRTKFVGTEPEIWVIGWDISLCRFGFFCSYKRILEGHWSDYDLKAMDYRKQPLEIIGNIHENPELIGKEKE